MAVDYATIVAGRVTAVTNGTLPASDLTTLYFDLTGYATPSVTDYFSEICATFSAAPPVIPDGDLAPPYPPGSTPPVPGSPEYPTGPGNPGPTPVPDLRPSLVVFHGDATDPVTILNCPAAETEIHARLRTRFLLADACAVRTQVWVITPVTGAEVITKYSVDGGSTFDYLSPGETGPVVDVATAGDRYGSYVNVATEAQGDVLLSPFIRGGDNSTTFVAGNLALLANIRTDATPCEEIAEGCDQPPAGAIDSIVFGEFADVAAIDTYVATTAEPTLMYNFLYTAEGYLDPSQPFNALPTMRGAVTANGFDLTNTLGRLYTVNAAGGFTKLWQRHLYLDPTMDMVCATDAEEGITLCNIDMSENVSGGGGSGDTSNVQIDLSLRNGRVMLQWRDGAGGFNGLSRYADLCAISAVGSQFIRWLHHVDLVGDQMRFRLYADEACAAVGTALYDETYTIPAAWTGLKMQTITFPAWDGPTPVGITPFWEAQQVFVDDPALLGAPA